MILIVDNLFLKPMSCKCTFCTCKQHSCILESWNPKIQQHCKSVNLFKMLMYSKNIVYLSTMWKWWLIDRINQTFLIVHGCISKSRNFNIILDFFDSVDATSRLLQKYICIYYKILYLLQNTIFTYLPNILFDVSCCLCRTK